MFGFFSSIWDLSISLITMTTRRFKVRGELCTSQLSGMQLCHDLQETEQTTAGKACGRTLGQRDPLLRSYCKKSESRSGTRYFRVHEMGTSGFHLISWPKFTYAGQVTSLPYSFKSSFESICNVWHFSCVGCALFRNQPVNNKPNISLCSWYAGLSNGSIRRSYIYFIACI